jgi:pyruvate dehydrogenase E2 component (dihydrolipoamide acetyltransferase)
VPATGEGTSVSTLSVETSRRGSSTADSSDQGKSEEKSAEEIEDAATSSSTPEATDEAAEDKTSGEAKKDEKSAQDQRSEKAQAAKTEGARLRSGQNVLLADATTHAGALHGGEVHALLACELAHERGADNGEPTTIQPVSDKRGTTEKAPRIRMTIAKRMRESLQEPEEAGDWAPDSAAARTSCLRMRPPTPVPFTEARSTPPRRRHRASA